MHVMTGLSAGHPEFPPSSQIVSTFSLFNVHPLFMFTQFKFKSEKLIREFGFALHEPRQQQPRPPAFSLVLKGSYPLSSRISHMRGTEGSRQ
jgi:hypothetical protein